MSLSLLEIEVEDGIEQRRVWDLSTIVDWLQDMTKSAYEIYGW